MHGPIAIGGLEPGMPDEFNAILCLFDSVNDDVDALADMLGGGREPKLLDKVDQPLGALKLRLLVDLAIHCRGACTLLLRVGEYGSVVELFRLDEIVELVRLLVRFAGETRHAGGPKDHAGNLRAKLGKEFMELLRITRSPHGLQNPGGAVLDGNIDVGQHLRSVSNCGDELVCHAFGLQIENANPAVIRAHRLCYAHEELGQGLIAIEIGSPDAGVLTDEHYLSDAPRHQRGNLRNDLV